MLTQILFAIVRTIGSRITAAARWWIEQRERAQEEMRESASNGDLTRWRLWLLLMRGADVNAKDIRDNTALHRASMHGHTDVAEILLEAGANVNAKDDIRGKTALHCAARNRHMDVARLLLEAGADVNARDGNGWTALHRASVNGHTEIANLLREYGAA